MYVNDVKQNICDGNGVPSITKESVSTALVNGNNGLGPVVGNFCMDLAIKKAKETGIGWVCTRGLSAVNPHAGKIFTNGPFKFLYCYIDKENVVSFSFLFSLLCRKQPLWDCRLVFYEGYQGRTLGEVKMMLSSSS